MRKLTSAKAMVTTTEFRLELTASTILDLLRANGETIPDDAKVFVHVPGGGDWSHEDLDIDAVSPLTVTWVKVDHAKEGG